MLNHRFFYFFERFNQVPAMIISANAIKKIFAAGSGANEGAIHLKLNIQQIQ